ncbi:MAG: putative replicase [Cressdnaviricota sp.]|nr:MAG: putative replicase [Cressdnaviricota sp.]
MEESMEPLFFFVALRKTEIDTLEAMIKEYPSGEYLICHEVAKDGRLKASDGEHIHVYWETCIKHYNTLIKRLKLKYNLNGKAALGKEAQYGRTKKDLRSEQRTKMYCLKDKGLYRTNLPDNEVSRLQQMSFPKPPDFTDTVTMYNKLNEEPYIQISDITWLRKWFINYNIVHKCHRDLSKSNIDRLVRQYISYYSIEADNIKAELIYDLFFYYNNY